MEKGEIQLEHFKLVLQSIDKLNPGDCIWLEIPHKTRINANLNYGEFLIESRRIQGPHLDYNYEYIYIKRSIN